jgi:hypothetical protein
LSNEFSQQKSVKQLNKHAQAAINIAAIVLPVIFTYLSFRGLPVMDILKALSEASVASILWKLVLAVYFLLWVLGTRIDSEEQAAVYLHAPNRGNLSGSAIGIIVALLIFGAILLYSRNFEEFVLALAAFYIVDFIAWRYLVRYVIRPIIVLSKGIYENKQDIIGIEKLAIIERRICGQWKWWRNSIGGIVILALGIIAFLKREDGTLPGFVPAISWELIQVIAMTVYVLVMEVWIWAERFRAKIALQLLEDLGERYTFRGITQ